MDYVTIGFLAIFILDMAKRNISVIYKVRRIHREWWVCQIDLEAFDGSMKKIEKTATRSQANHYADDHDQQFLMDQFIEQEWLTKKDA